MSLLGGASALALLGGSQASAAPPVDEVNLLQPARSFAELLDPIPNAEKVLRAEDERSADAAANMTTLKKTDSWQQAAYVEKGGWAVMPGSKAADSGVSQACAALLSSVK